MTARLLATGRVALLTLGLGACVATPPPSRTPPPRPTAPPVRAPERLAEALSGMIWPLPVVGPREITSTYGARGVRHHDGLDIRGRAGDVIFAAREGRTLFSGWMRGYGYIVILDHGGGVTTRYGHASELLVAAGERVTRGQPIARVGATGNATGNHLHFEVLWGGHPFDPTSLLPRVGAR